MRIAYTNFLDSLSSSSILASSYDTSYPVTNVQDQRLTVKWHSDEATTQTVVFDLGSTTTTSIYAILSHNLTSTGTVTVVGNDDIASGLTWVTSGESSTQTITYNQNMMVKMVSPIINRYYKFTFSGQAEGGVQIGRLWIGNYIQISPSSLDSFTVIKKRSDTVVYGKNRQKYASIGKEWRRFELTFPKTSPTGITAIQTLFSAVGNHSSFLFMNFDDLRTYDLVEPCYVSIDGDIGFIHQRAQYYSYSLALEEDL